MPIFLLTMANSGATVVNGLNAAIVSAEDTSLARELCNTTYPGGSTNLWAGAFCQEISAVNLGAPIFLASPARTQPGSIPVVET